MTQNKQILKISALQKSFKKKFPSPQKKSSPVSCKNVEQVVAKQKIIVILIMG